MDPNEEKALRDEIDKVALEINELKKTKGPGDDETKAAVARMGALRAKLPQADKSKKKEAAAAAKPATQSYFDTRVSAVNQIGQLTGAYPHKFTCSISLPAFRDKFGVMDLKEGERVSEAVSLAGRIMTKRSSGSKLHFLVLQGDGVTLQVVSMSDDYQEGLKVASAVTGAENQPQDFTGIHHLLKRGDIVGVTGFPGKSKTGELSIFATRLTLLSACFHMLPDDWFGLANIEQRYRDRPLDLIVGGGARAKTFATRSKVITHIRHFFDSYDFLEVETPVLNAIAGGAAARPFVTHHNDLNQQMFLRIAPELYLKECIVGGLDRVYELGRQFRNEGIDPTHNPEFTSIEAYWAYKDYNDIMEMTEELLSTLAVKLFGSTDVPFNPIDLATGKPIREQPLIFNFKPPYKRIRIIPELEKRLKIEFPKDFEEETTNAWLQAKCKELKIECTPPFTTPRLLDAMISEVLEPECVQPTFLCDHPRVMSPLAKWHREDPRLTERFELFVNKKELANAYTELNNPLIQREEFKKQLKNRDKGDDEAMELDESFLHALELGLPPTGGWGLGVDRLVMLMTSNITIKEVLLFPAMRSEAHSATPKYAAGTRLNGRGVPLAGVSMPWEKKE